jgi:hypothetical protein
LQRFRNSTRLLPEIYTQQWAISQEIFEKKYSWTRELGEADGECFTGLHL